MNALLVATLQVSVILLVALGIAGLLRRKSAVLRHAVIAIGMGCAAIVPLLDALLPTWLSAPAMPAIERAMTVTELRPLPATPQVSSVHLGPMASAPGEIPAGTGSPRRAQTRDAAISASLAGDLPAGTRSPAGIVANVYLAGLVIALSMLAVELLWICWMSARSGPMRSPAWHRHFAAVSGKYALRRNVQLRQVRHATLLATWGFLRPKVLLPDGVEAWPEQRIRAVLLHELAHVRRNDWLVQVLAAVLRAVYWFNPLVWLACHRLQQLSELACDDAVIGDGIGETEYASELLAVARGMARRPFLLGPAPSMARRSTLQRRVTRILDAAADRSRLEGGALGWIVLSLLVVTCTAAACGSRQQTSPAAADTPPLPEVAATGAIEAHETGTAPVPETSPRQEEVAQPVPVAIATSAGSTSTGSVPAASPQHVVADVLQLVNAALADESTAVLDEITYPITGLRHLQRYAQAVVSDEGNDPSALAANCVQIINALVNTGNLAANTGRRPGAVQSPSAALVELSRKLHASAVALKDSLLPIPAESSPAASTPERRAAAAARDLARDALRDVAFVGSRQGSWLVTELDTLERAASSVVQDTGTDAGALRLRLHALRGSLRSAGRQMTQFSGREDRARTSRDKAAALTASLAEVGTRLDAAMSGQQGVTARDPLAAVLARVAEDLPDLQLVTLRRSADTFIATLGNGGPAPINILIEDALTEAEASRKEELAVLGAAMSGTLRERNGVRLNTWGEEGGDTGYRVLARVGTRVVNISAPPDMSTYVLPVLDRIVAQIR